MTDTTVLEVPALNERQGFLVPLTGCTEAWRVTLKIPQDACLCGGLSGDAETRSLQPWSTTNEYLKRLAQESSTKTPDEPAEAATLETRFRRDSRGHLCLTGNMIRTMLQETGRAIYSDDNGWFTLRRGLRFNMRIEPTLIPIKRKGVVIGTPDGIMELPRVIRSAPFERSILQRPEYVKGPVEVEFLLAISQIGTGAVVRSENVEYMLEYAGSYIGLGAHRGVDTTWAGSPGRFEVVDFEQADLAEILGSAVQRKDPPPLIVPERKKAGAKAKKPVEEPEAE